MIVLEQGGFTPMSGSNTMCAVTAAIETGIVAAVEPVTEVHIDTAVGTTTARAQVRDGKVVAVTVVNVPAFVVALDLPRQVPELGTLAVDVVFGGQFFVQVPVTATGLTLHPGLGRELVGRAP
jgi:proline racemase